MVTFWVQDAKSTDPFIWDKFSIPLPNTCLPINSCLPIGLKLFTRYLRVIDFCILWVSDIKPKFSLIVCIQTVSFSKIKKNKKNKNKKRTFLEFFLESRFNIVIIDRKSNKRAWDILFVMEQILILMEQYGVPFSF